MEKGELIPNGETFHRVPQSVIRLPIPPPPCVPSNPSICRASSSNASARGRFDSSNPASMSATNGRERATNQDRHGLLGPQKQYPFPFTRRRRMHELNYLVPRLARTRGKSLLDLGCGDGALLECLLRTTEFEEFHGYDVAGGLLRDIDPRVQTAVFDISNPGPSAERGRGDHRRCHPVHLRR